jgi:mannonate dehydratase
MQLRQTWRWFGPGDPVSLQYIRQTGTQGIVTALHHIPHGETWPVAEIKRRQAEVAAGGLTWDVVESVTVHESIKTRTGRFQQYIDAYKQTLRNLAACGLRIVTYNFMPVNDWTRTDLHYAMPDGSLALYFDWADLAVFDRYLLQRKGAEGTYPEAVLREAEARYRQYTPDQLEGLAGIIMFGIPGEKKQTLEGMRARLAAYADIDHHALRENLKLLSCRRSARWPKRPGSKLAIHPDDPALRHPGSCPAS